MRNIQPAVAGAVTAPRALAGAFVRGLEASLLLSPIRSACADLLCEASGSRFIRRTPLVILYASA
jgi:hypothetical protein